MPVGSAFPARKSFCFHVNVSPPQTSPTLRRQGERCCCSEETEGSKLDTISTERRRGPAPPTEGPRPSCRCCVTRHRPRACDGVLRHAGRLTAVSASTGLLWPSSLLSLAHACDCTHMPVHVCATLMPCLSAAWCAGFVLTRREHCPRPHPALHPTRGQGGLDPGAARSQVCARLSPSERHSAQ